MNHSEFTQPAQIGFKVPSWLDSLGQAYLPSLDPQQRMALVLKAAMTTIREQGGGPFAAVVFRIETGDLISLGVNLVTGQGMSMLHAEMVAIALAQRKLKTFDLAAVDQAPFELVTSSEPCAMCLGAIPWSGVKRVVTGATDAAVRRIGFDEGTKPDDWHAGLLERGIAVQDRVSEEEAEAVLWAYHSGGGHLY